MVILFRMVMIVGDAPMEMSSLHRLQKWSQILPIVSTALCNSSQVESGSLHLVSGFYRLICFRQRNKVTLDKVTRVAQTEA